MTVKSLSKPDSSLSLGIENYVTLAASVYGSLLEHKKLSTDVVNEWTKTEHSK